MIFNGCTRLIIIPDTSKWKLNLDNNTDNNISMVRSNNNKDNNSSNSLSIIFSINTNNNSINFSSSSFFIRSNSIGNNKCNNNNKNSNLNVYLYNININFNNEENTEYYENFYY